VILSKDEHRREFRVQIQPLRAQPSLTALSYFARPPGSEIPSFLFTIPPLMTPFFRSNRLFQNQLPTSPLRDEPRQKFGLVLVPTAIPSPLARFILLRKVDTFCLKSRISYFLALNTRFVSRTPILRSFLPLTPWKDACKKFLSLDGLLWMRRAAFHSA